MDRQVVAIVVAAGSGRRMGFDKVLHPLRDKPLFLHATMAMAEHEKIDKVLVVTRKDILQDVKSLLDAEGHPKILPPIEGGDHRYESVWNGLRSLEEYSPDIVLIQDGARPFPATKMIDESIAFVGQTGASCVAIPAQDTLKESPDGKNISRTLDRSKVWLAQTPQTFQYSLIHSAYKELLASGELAGVTDDASLIERVGRPVAIVEGSSRNIKVTRPEDFTIAEALLGLQAL